MSLLSSIGVVSTFAVSALKDLKTAPATPLSPNFVSFGGPLSIQSTLVSRDPGTELRLSQSALSPPSPETDQINFRRYEELKLSKIPADKHPQ